MNTPLRCICLLSVLLAGCSSDSDNSIVPANPTQDDQTLNDSTQDDPTVNDPTQDDQATVMDVSNYDSILIASMDVLRTDVYARADLLLRDIETLWSLNNNVEAGVTQIYDCEAGGTVSREVTRQPDLAENRRVTRLELNACITDGITLNGTVGMDELGSDFQSLGDGNSTQTLGFSELTLKQFGTSETIKGVYVQFSDGTSAYATKTSTIELYQKTQRDNTISLSDATYTYHFEHDYEQNPEDTSRELIRWRYSETGSGTLSISALGLSDVSLVIEPELVYINKPEDQFPNYTDTLSTGELELTVPTGGKLNVSVASVENGTVLYTLTDSNGQQTAVEREWLSPAPL